METISFDIEHPPKLIKIAKETETGIKKIQIDISYWVSSIENLQIIMLVRKPNGRIYFPNFDIDGSIITWEITEYDTDTPGIGMVELEGKSENKRIVSEIFKVSIQKRMEGIATNVPEESNAIWVEKVFEAVKEAKKYAEEAKKYYELAKSLQSSNQT